MVFAYLGARRQLLHWLYEHLRHIVDAEVPD
jgi:hypothetical protein